MDTLNHHHNSHHNRHDEDHDPSRHHHRHDEDHDPSRHHHRHDEDNLDQHPSRHHDDPYVCRARDDANGHDDGDRVTHEDEHGSGPFLPILSGGHSSQCTR